MMQSSAECATAWLSVTDLVNERWSERLSASFALNITSQPASADASFLPAPSQTASELLCSDAISIRPEQMTDPGFNAATFVMEAALTHTERYCRQRGVSIPFFRSVEVLRLSHPRNGALSFLFLMETGLPA